MSDLSIFVVSVCSLGAVYIICHTISSIKQGKNRLIKTIWDEIKSILES